MVLTHCVCSNLELVGDEGEMVLKVTIVEAMWLGEPVYGTFSFLEERVMMPGMYSGD